MKGRRDGEMTGRRKRQMKGRRDGVNGDEVK
jgi:hypothetical protein